MNRRSCSFFLNLLKKNYYFKYYLKKKLLLFFFSSYEIILLKKLYLYFKYFNINTWSSHYNSNICILTSKKRSVNNKFLLSKLSLLLIIRKGLLSGYKSNQW